MKKALLLVTALMALQTSAFALTCKSCTPIGCRQDATFDYCKENCSDSANFARCEAAHEDSNVDKAGVAERQEQIDKDAENNAKDIEAAS